MELEDLNLQERLDNAREELRIISEKNALSESTRDDIRAEAEARARVFELEEESLGRQTEVFTKLQSFEQARTEEFKRLAQERIDAIVKEREENARLFQEKLAWADAEATKEVERKAVIDDRFNSYVEGVTNEAIADREIVIPSQNMMTENQLQNNAKERTSFEDLANARVQIAQGVFGALTGLADIMSTGDERRARQAFKLNKALGVANATANTYAGVNAVLADKTIPTPAKPFAIASVIATGLANVLKIKNTQFTGGGSGGGSSASGLSVAQVATQAPTIPQVGEPETEQAPIRAFVVGKEVTSTQAQTQQINEQANLVL